jgi:hypothetical protein
MPSPYPWKVEQARELHEKGYTVNQIAARINVQPQTARRYVDPAYDERIYQREKKRKLRYGGTCAVCGKRTSYSGRKTTGSELCAEHSRRHQKYWTRERIIEAIQKWAKVHGNPPSSADWNATLSKVERGKEYPAAGTVFQRGGPFASWADAIEAAGFPRPKVTYSGKHGELIWTKERILEALREHAVDGVAPVSTEWHHRGPGRPTNSWVAQKFGTWANACHEAGLLTHQEAYWHGRRPHRPRKKSKEVVSERTELNPKERLAFVQRVMDDCVPRRFVIQQLWNTWGFRSKSAFAYWLTKNGLKELPGQQFRTRRQLTREELAEAHELALPPAVRAQKSEV